MLEYQFTTQINKPVDDVFNALVNKLILCEYFCDSADIDLSAGKEVIWSWKAWGDYPVVVKSIEENRLIVLAINSKTWQKTVDDNYNISVHFTFEPQPHHCCLLTISESGWHNNPEGIKASHENCAGWQHMAMCLKAYLEHNVDLRQ